MFQLRFTTVVEAPLTVAFDVARTLGPPWGAPLEEVVSVRPVRDVYAVGPGRGWRWLTHSRRFSATGAGTQVDEQVDWATGLPGLLGGFVDQVVLRRRILRAMQATSTPTRPRPRGGRSTSCRWSARRSSTATGCWSRSARGALRRLLGVPRRQGRAGGVRPVGAGARDRGGAGDDDRAAGLPRRGRAGRRRRRWTARARPRCGSGGPGSPAGRRSRTSTRRCAGCGPTELDDLDWIAADRPLLPAVRALLTRL